MAVKVVVAGATGKTGRVIARGVSQASDLELVGAVAPHHAGRRLGNVIDIPGVDIPIHASVAEALARRKADVLVDFTTPEAGFGNAMAALERGVRPVVGTTGLGAEQLEALDAAARRAGLAAIVAPNFSIGGLLMERLAAQAAALMPMVEVIEMHHAQKKDAPSGTAARLAERLAAAGARAPVPVHSVRLPGFVAHHEVLFGGQGEALVIRHDAYSREAFVPGVLIAVRAVVHAEPGLITQLWPLIERAAQA
ncbi:MAG: 4-hydroxy-tetrahydrodipicolinate reductase [Firmicutes bacterium]|nr:4-hydroxy-tetrahydrodipicolinate reductase [Bacillota bacterium]